MRLAIIDLGTNTFNLLIASAEKDRLVIHHEEERPVFLGKGGIEKGVIAADAFARGMGTLAAYARIAAEQGADHIAGFGTSALRNARNAREFVDRAQAELAIDIRIIPGEEEAGLILDGVRLAVPFASKPMLVMDIGGGSIEFILATDKALMWKHSFELGVTRLRERFSPSDPITVEEQFRIGAFLDARLEPLWNVMDRHWPTALVGSAGSFDTIAHVLAMEQGRALDGNERARTFDGTAVELLKERLLTMPREERLCVPGLPAHRVDTIGLAMIAVERVMVQGIDEVRWSRFALKEGAAARLLGLVH